MKVWINRIAEKPKGFTDLTPAYREHSKENNEVWDFLDSINGESKIDSYIPLKVKKMNKKGILLNVAWLRTGLLVIDEEAVNVLKKYIDLYGELLPLELKEKEKSFYIFNVTNVVDCLDEEKSEFHILGYSKKITNVRKPIFKEDIVKNNDIFRIPRHGKSFTFISDDLKKYIESSGLTGFNFKLAWDSEVDEKYRLF